jgi:hypothetical protein
MKKTLLGLLLLISGINGYAQTPEIGHFQQLATVRRGDTLDVAWYYKPAQGVDIRGFQVDWQFKKTLFTHISTTVDASVNSNTPVVDYKSWESFKFDSYSNGNYNYTADADWTIGRNYLILSNGNSVSSNGYIIHNKYKINNVGPNYVSDSITLNWARMIKLDGTSIGDNVATLSYKKLADKLLGNLTISGKVFLPSSVTSSGLLPTINCYDFNTNQLISSTVPNSSTGNYTLTNIDENKKYKIELKFPQDSLASLRDRAVTISDAVKTYNEFTSTDVNQVYGRQFLRHPLSYLIADLNLTGTLDAGDPYGIYASVSGLRPIDLTKLINVFKKSEYDSLVTVSSTWSTWSSYSNRGIIVTDSVGLTNLTLDLKYFILGDVDRTHSSPVFDAQGGEIMAANFSGNFNIDIPNQYVVGQPMYVPFNIQTNGLQNTGLQFEMSYDINKVKFEEIQSNLGGPWLQYVNHDPQKGIIRFGGMNNQKTGALIGAVTPFKLKFTAVNPSEDIATSVYVRKLMDASHSNGDHFNITLNSSVTVLTYRAMMVVTPSETDKITFRLFPNPTESSINLEINLPKQTVVNASIYDIGGKEILNLGKIHSNDVDVKIIKRLNVQGLANGVYQLVIFDSKNKTTKQFIKI